MSEQKQKNLIRRLFRKNKLMYKYTYFANIAQREGYDHSPKSFWKQQEMSKTMPDLVWRTRITFRKNSRKKENLLRAVESENYEWTDMYARFARCRRRRLQALLRDSVMLQQLKKLWKSVIVHYWKKCRDAANCSKKGEETMLGIPCMRTSRSWEKKLLRCVLCANIRKNYF